MKIRTDFVTNSSSSSFTVDLYGIDVDNNVCYHMDANQDGEYPRLITICNYNVKNGIYTAIDPDNRFDIGDYDENKIESLPVLLSVLRQITMIESHLDDEDFCDEDLDDEDYWKVYEVRKDWKSDCEEKGDIDLASEVILVCGQSGYGESLISFNDGEEFTWMRKRFSEADDDEKEEIIDEATHFFHDLPEWVAYCNGEAIFGRLFISDTWENSPRETYEFCLEYGVDEVNANYYELAFIDPKTFAIKRKINILSWLHVLDGEDRLLELVSRIQKLDEKQKAGKSKSEAAVKIVKPKEKSETFDYPDEIDCNGKAFVTTYLDPDDELMVKSDVSSRGGAVRGAVSGKTNYLIAFSENVSSTKLSSAIKQKQKRKDIQIITLDYYMKLKQNGKLK